ncbi:MAG: hypothetical protein HQK77_16950 [Desulfobacterales bacterium]|nr:hypothetical protein [Desulfobacterales bacterium]
MELKIKFNRRLSYRQAKNTVIIALILGLSVSAIQIAIDFINEREKTDRVVLEVISMFQDSAARAVYDIDELAAKGVILGLFKYQPIHQVDIKDNFGSVLNTGKREDSLRKKGWLEHLARKVFEENKKYSVDLFIAGHKNPVGIIEVSVDTYLVAENFFSRAVMVFISGILRNIALSCVLMLMFYYLLTQPLLKIVKTLNKVDTNKPGEMLIEVSKDHKDDELGLLVNTINMMLNGFDNTLINLRKSEQVIRELNKDLEQRVKDRTYELEAANKELEAFSYSVSHDLRAPLRALDGFSQALTEDYYDKLDDEGRDFLQRIRLASQKMGGLIDDLLKLSRVTRDEMKRDKVNLSAMVVEILEILRTREPDRNVKTSVQGQLTVYGDPFLIRIMLDNLLGNAWKYSSKVAEARIYFGSENTTGVQHFYIKDNGAGFNMIYVEKLFKAFNRLHTPDQFDGTGIGLAIVQRVINRHGGRIWAEAKEGEGAIFRFIL